MRLPFAFSTFACSAALLGVASPAFAQAPPTGGAPPADLAPAITVPKGPGDAPKPNDLSVDSMDAALSAGGQFATGNSRTFASTGLGKFSIRRGADAFGASLLGNYAEAFVVPAPVAGAAPAPGFWQRSTENIQGKLRYDRYLARDFSVFAQVTGLHDAFQAIGFRLNADPGVKYLVVDKENLRVWGEAGYDFQFDDNYTYPDGIEEAGNGSGPALDANNLPYVINRTDTIESSRLFAGFHYAFNKEVQLNVGLEYLQGFGGSGGGTPALPGGGWNASQVDLVPISLTASRLNLDALLAAHVAGGVSIGVGFTAKYNSSPLPGKVDLDTSGTVALIYAFSSPSPKPANCPCPSSPPPPPMPPPPPPPPPPSAPAVGLAPASAAPPPPAAMPSSASPPPPPSPPAPAAP